MIKHDPLSQISISSVFPIPWEKMSICSLADPDYADASCLLRLMDPQRRKTGEKGLIVAAAYEDLLILAVSTTACIYASHAELLTWAIRRNEFQSKADWRGGSYISIDRGLVQIEGEAPQLGPLPRSIRNATQSALQEWVYRILEYI
jgi:hypothetical protein